MTIERENRNGPFVIQCDERTESLELFSEDFAGAIEDASDHGFEARKHGEKWRHLCSHCSRN